MISAPLTLAQNWWATWRSGDVADCKSAYPGSIPGVASKFTAMMCRLSACLNSRGVACCFRARALMGATLPAANEQDGC